MAVDTGASDAELGGVLGDGVTAFPVVLVSSYICRASFDLPGTQFRFAAGTAPGPSGGQAVHGRSDIRACSIGDAPRMWKNILPIAVEVSMTLVEHDQVHAGCQQVPGQRDQVFQRPAQPIQLVTTSWSPARLADSNALSNSGRRASLPEALSRKAARSPPR